MGKVFVRYICAYCILVTAKETIDYMMNAVWSRNAVLYEMNLRQATPEGTLAAAAERLGFCGSWASMRLLMPHYPIGEVGRKGSLAPIIRFGITGPSIPNWGRWPISTLLFGGLTPWE